MDENRDIEQRVRLVQTINNIFNDRYYRDMSPLETLITSEFIRFWQFFPWAIDMDAKFWENLYNGLLAAIGTNGYEELWYIIKEVLERENH